MIWPKPTRRKMDTCTKLTAQKDPEGFRKVFWKGKVTYTKLTPRKGPEGFQKQSRKQKTRKVKFSARKSPTASPIDPSILSGKAGLPTSESQWG